MHTPSLRDHSVGNPMNDLQTESSGVRGSAGRRLVGLWR
jgi:hypothetical protein